MQLSGVAALLAKLEQLPKEHKYGELRVFIGPPNSYTAVFARTTRFCDLPVELQVALMKIVDWFKATTLEIVCGDDGTPRKVLTTHLDIE